MSVYRYYDTPDGQDWFLKQCYLLSKASYPSGAYMVFDVFYFTSPVGVFPVVERCIRTFSRPLIFASIWGTGTYVATKLRGKDDPWNHVIGNFCAFKYWRYLYPRPQTVWGLFAWSSVILAGYKFAKTYYGYNFLYDMYDVREHQDALLHSDLISYTTEPIWPRKWLTAAEAKEKGLI